MEFKKTLAVIGTALFLGAALSGCVTDDKITQEDLDAQIEAAKLEAKNSVDITADNDAVVADATAEKAAEIEKLNAVIEDYKQAEAEVDAEDEKYLIDDLSIGQTFVEVISDREVNKLIDDEVEFDNDDYEIEEVVTLTGTVSSNEEDYNGLVYLQVDEENLKYEVTFDNDLDTSDIDEDDTLEFSFLGEDVEITDWDGDKVTFTKGTEVLVESGQIYTVGDVEITVRVIGEDYIYVGVGDNSVKIDEGETEKINDIEIKAEEVMDDDDSPDQAVLIVSDDVDQTVEDGDEYNANYDWIISGNSIGIELSADFMELDEDNKPLATGESISLPNDYLTVEFAGLVEDKLEKIDFEDDDDYDVEVNGNFVLGLEDYNRLYMNVSGFYDEDDELIGQALDIENTELTLSINGNFLTVDDVDVKWVDLTKIKVSGNNICDEEEDYMTNYGILIESPEDSCDDEEYAIYVPEDEQTAQIRVY